MSLTVLADFLIVVIITLLFNFYHYCCLGAVLLLVFIVADAALAADTVRAITRTKQLGI